MSMISGIQGQLLEVTVVSCNKLKDTEWISRQDPYVCLEYGSTKFRTRTCTDGGKNPTFQEKFVFTLIEGLLEINVVVWNSNSLTYDDLIGSGKIQLQQVLSMGYDDTAWPIQTKTGRHAGEVWLIMFYANASKLATSYAPHTQHHRRIHLCTPFLHQQQLIKHHLHILLTRLIQQRIHQHLILLLNQLLTLQFIHRLQHILPCLIHHFQHILPCLIHCQHRTTLILQVHIREHILHDLTEATFECAYKLLTEKKFNVHIGFH